MCSFFHLPLVRLLYSHMLPDKDIKNIGYFTELLPIYREILKNLLIKYFFSKSLPSSCLFGTYSTEPLCASPFTFFLPKLKI